MTNGTSAAPASFSEIDRPVTRAEYREALAIAPRYGLNRLDQELAEI
jgi:hypothetical protein